MYRWGVRLSVCLSRRPTATAVCGGFAAERPTAGGIDRQRSAVNAGSVTLTAEGRS